jgi:hypothetical protein
VHKGAELACRVFGGDAFGEDVGLAGKLIILNPLLFFDFEGGSDT